MASELRRVAVIAAIFTNNFDSISIGRWKTHFSHCRPRHCVKLNRTWKFWFSVFTIWLQKFGYSKILLHSFCIHQCRYTDTGVSMHMGLKVGETGDRKLYMKPDYRRINVNNSVMCQNLNGNNIYPGHGMVASYIHSVNHLYEMPHRTAYPNWSECHNWFLIEFPSDSSCVVHEVNMDDTCRCIWDTWWARARARVRATTKAGAKERVRAIKIVYCENQNDHHSGWRGSTRN